MTRLSVRDAMRHPADLVAFAGIKPGDPHTGKVFAPGIRGHIDRFVFRFRKPAH